MIVEKIWDQSFEGLTNIVDVYIGHLRRKIDEGHEPKLIRTVRGLGYMLDTDQRAMILRSVTSRLVLSYCLLLVLLGGAFLAFTVLSFQHYTRETITTTLAARAQEIWNTVAGRCWISRNGWPDVIDRRFAPEAAGPLHPHPRWRHAALSVRRSGRRMISSAGTVPLPDRRQGRRARRMIGNLLLYSRSFHATRTARRDRGYRPVLPVRPHVQDRLATSLFVGLPVLLLLAALAGYVLMRRALTPVEVMINAAETYTFNDPHNRLPLVGTEPRIEALGLALNRMLDRLDGAYSHVSRFSADAAHELRTPLTIIRGELELVAAQRTAPIPTWTRPSAMRWRK